MSLITTPGRVSGLSHNIGGNTRTGSLSWAPVSGALEYDVSGGNGLSQTTQGTSYPISNIVESISYRVRAKNICGYGPWASTSIVIDNLPGCINVSASIVNCDVRFNWSAPFKNGSNITSYKIYIKSGSGYKVLSNCGFNGETSCT